MFWRVFVEVEQHRDRWRCAARKNLAAVPGCNDVRDLDLGARRNLALGLHRIEDDTLAGHPICGGLVVGGRGLVPVPRIIAHGSTWVAAAKDERARLSPSVLVGTLAAKKLLFSNVRCERLLGTPSGEKPCVINKQVDSERFRSAPRTAA
jgi:hypothetical protein